MRTKERERADERKSEEREELTRFNLDLLQTLAFHQPSLRKILFSLSLFPFVSFSIFSLSLRSSGFNSLYMSYLHGKNRRSMPDKRRIAAENRSLLNVEARPSHPRSILGWLEEFGYCAGRWTPIESVRCIILYRDDPLVPIGSNWSHSSWESLKIYKIIFINQRQHYFLLTKM